MTCRKCSKDLPDGAPYCCWCGTKQAPPPTTAVKHRGNGTGSVVKLANGKYRARVVIGWHTSASGKPSPITRSKVFVKKSDAMNALPTLYQTQNKPRTATLAELYSLYQSGRDYASLGNSQRDKLRYAWNRLKPLGNLHIEDITVADMEDCINEAVSTYYPARDMKVLLSHLFTIAIKHEMITTNKTEFVDIPDAPKARRECWTNIEVKAMWDDYRSGHTLTAYLLIMCYTGMRFGELSKMELANIHLDERYMIGGIKTEAGIDREIPIHEAIVPLIRDVMRGRKRKLLEMNDDNFYAAYWAMVERTGIRQLPAHTCRHWYFTAMTAAGVQSGIITETGGHASYITTMKNYVRISLDDKIKAVNSIGEL